MTHGCRARGCEGPPRAGEGSRTPTPFRAPGPKPGAAASYATPAGDSGRHRSLARVRRCATPPGGRGARCAPGRGGVRSAQTQLPAQPGDVPGGLDVVERGDDPSPLVDDERGPDHTGDRPAVHLLLAPRAVGG